MDMKLGPTLTDLLKEKRISIKELATACNISAKTLYEWKSNRTPRNLNDVKKVAEVLGVSLHYLIFGENDKTTISPLEQHDDEIKAGVYEVVLRRVK